MSKKSKTNSTPKFEAGDEIIDEVFGKGKILYYTKWDEANNVHVYNVRYYCFDSRTETDSTHGCPENEMRHLTKLDKVLK